MLRVVAAAVVGSAMIVTLACPGGSTSNMPTVPPPTETSSDPTTTPSTETPPIDYCELANHPERYDGQAVRVSATLYFMMHGDKFMDRACLGDEKETAVILNAKHEAKLAKAMGMDEYVPWPFPKIIATGRFKRVIPNRKSDAVEDNTDLIFEMDDVERVISVSNN
jgi:hypothetical protein